MCWMLEATSVFRDCRASVCARNLEGDERDRGWEKIVEQDPSFAEYKQRTHGVMEIPVVLLEPLDHQAIGH